ncbi:MAG TPA: F0F1 ATP synthase subunit A, partial [Hyphomicrobiales bacterium]|nr:F0F1 ATP synthase subunit A [Hyphomicrobiales bacterium]
MFRLSPLTNEVAFWLGPIPITGAVVTTWGVMAAITAFCAISLRRPKVEPDGVQSLLEILIEAIAAQIEAVLRRDPWPFMPLIGTLFIFLVVANLSAIVPGLHPPTGHIETPAALA